MKKNQNWASNNEKIKIKRKKRIFIRVFLGGKSQMKQNRFGLWRLFE